MRAFILILFLASSVIADDWIHVVTSTKTPTIRSGQTSPFEVYENGFDPNSDGGFGPGQPTMFLPVTKPSPPAINPITQKRAIIKTLGTDSNQYNGQYLVGPPEVWEWTWVVSEQDLSTSKQLKLELLEIDKQVAIDTGYTVGPYTIDFSEETLNFLHARLLVLERAIAFGDRGVDASTEITISDKNGLEVRLNVAQLESQYVNYGLAYFTIEQKAINKRDAINKATTVQQVDAVTWTF